MNRRLNSCKTIDLASQRIINAETNHWNEVLLRILAISKTLRKSGLAFQGTSDKLFEYKNVIWHKILNSINRISKLIKTKDFDLAFALLQNCKIFLKNLRSDSSFDKIIIDAKELATEIDVESNFGSTITRHHVRRRKRNFLYEAQDEPIKDPKEKYKIDFFYFTIDQALNALGARFEQLSNSSNYFQFLYNMYYLNIRSKEMVLKHCKNLECILTDGDSFDICGCTGSWTESYLLLSANRSVRPAHSQDGASGLLRVTRSSRVEEEDVGGSDNRAAAILE
ncbi:uncharacterized protein [Centruroides vittatus]|uniref:uncharacterized protein n=1 Tax=Centruroides vittatus TaxID=120091 RepID=UPI0035100C85